MAQEFAARLGSGAEPVAVEQQKAGVPWVELAGLGWDILKEIIHGQGGVTYEKVQMRGMKYPLDERAKYAGRNPEAGPKSECDGWFQSWQQDKVGIWCDLNWKFDHHGVGNIELLKRELEGAFTKWNLRVESSLLPDAQYYEGRYGPCVAVKLTNVYEWSHWIWDSKIAREIVTLYGDGRWHRKFEWTQQ